MPFLDVDTVTSRPSPAGSLVAALEASSRTTQWGVMKDPIAQDVLKSQNLCSLIEALKRYDLVPLTPLSGGVGSVVLDAGDRVLRLGMGASLPYPAIPEMLQPLAQGNVGYLRYEVLPKVLTVGVTPAHVEALILAVSARGYVWSDAGVDNVGFQNGRAVILDPGGVDPLPLHNARPSQKRQASAV